MQVSKSNESLKLGAHYKQTQKIGTRVWYLTCDYHKLKDRNGKALLAVRFLFNEACFLSVKMKPYTSMPS